MTPTAAASDLPATLEDGVTLECAIADDVPAIVRLLADDPLGAGRETAPDDPSYEQAFAQIDADPQQVLVVAWVGGEVVGCLQLTFIPGLSHAGATRAQVEGVRVAPSHRSRGLGEQMLRWCAEYSRGRGARMLQLTTNASRTRAHGFYERLGYVASHVGMKLDLTQ